jgi:phosphatidylglycerophosphatase A
MGEPTRDGEPPPYPSPGVPGEGTEKLRRPWRLWLVTMGGAGLLPKMPGTYGSAVAALLVWIVFHFLGPSQWVLVAGLIFFSVVCVALGGWAQEFLGRKDPGPVVAVEGAGICLTLLFQPQYGTWTFVAAFLAFRLFDITKPPPARQLERLSAGWGILADDLAAAVYANLLCQVVLRFVLK